MTRLRWILLAAGSAYACQLAAQTATPVDRALPLIGLAVVAFAWASRDAILAAVPALVVCASVFPGEHLRLFAYGVVVAAAISLALAFAKREDDFEEKTLAMPLIAIAALVLLRWIPLAEVRVGRELAILAIAALIVFVLGRTPLSVAVAVAAGLFTPAVPLRTLALPLAVLVVAAIARIFGMQRLRALLPSIVWSGFVMLFFAWSGVTARSFTWFLRAAAPPAHRVTIAEAIPPGRSVTFDVPEGASNLIVSGANVARLAPGTVVGRIEPGRSIVIGDVADWGFMRRDVFYGTRNALPRDPAGTLRSYGYTAWVDGAGRIAVPAGVRTIRVTADPDLPGDASLQVEGFEVQAR